MNNEKVVVDVYYTYGKHSGEELSDRLIIKNNKEERSELFDTFSFDEAIDSKDDFINGESNFFGFDKFGGDWDEPTGGFIVVSTKEALIEEIKEEASREIAEVEKLFS